MNRLADPYRCPSCRHALPTDVLVCSSCGLDLRGAPGVRLFALLTEADDLIAHMRTEPLGASAAPAPAATPAPRVQLGAAPVTKPAPRVQVATVPRVLLGLGALCVLVAASLFLPFAWELLGVVGRTVALIAATAAAVLAARAAATRGLRATAEALGVVAAGLLTFDLLGGRASGWFGDVSDAGFAVLVGAVLVITGTGVALWLRRTEIGVLTSGEVVAVVGGAVLAWGAAGLEVGTLSLRLAVVVPLLGAVALGTAATRVARAGADSMGLATGGHLAVTATTWLALGTAGVAGLADGLSWAAVWTGAAGPTLLVTGAYAALPALDRRRSASWRTAWLSVALVPWALLLTAPAYDEGQTWLTSVLVAALLVCLAASLGLARPWRAALLPVGGLSAAAATMLVAPLAGLAATTYVETVAPVWAGSPGARVVPSDPDGLAGAWDAAALGSPWLLPLVVLSLGLAVAVLVAAVEGAEDTDDEGGRRWLLAVVGATVLVLAVAGAMLLAAVPVWSVFAVLLTSSTAGGLAAWRAGRLELHLAQVVLGIAAVVLSWSDEWLTLTSCLVLLPLAALHHVRGDDRVRAGGGLAVTLLLGGALWTGGALLAAPPVWTCLVVLVVTSALVVTTGLRGRDIAGIEGGAVAVAVAAVATGVEAAPAGVAATWLAAYLTAAGVAATLVALTRRDRRVAGWAGGLLLAGASWVRLADVGVSTPEAYTLPSALALLVAGWVRTHRDVTLGTLSAWSPGLALALVPSLTWALADPVSLRALLLGASCFVLAVAGAQWRLAALLTWGAGVGAVLALWEVIPPAVEMSAWLVTGLAGAALLVLGASWERRVSEARAAFAQLRSLR